MMPPKKAGKNDRKNLRKLKYFTDTPAFRGRKGGGGGDREESERLQRTGKNESEVDMEVKGK